MLYYSDRRKLHHGKGFNRISKENYKMTDGNGIIEDIIKPAINFIKDNKDLLKNVGESAVSTYTIGKNTKEIVDSIKNKNKNENLTQNELIALEHKKVKDVIKRINKLNTKGSGFAIV